MNRALLLFSVVAPFALSIERPDSYDLWPRFEAGQEMLVTIEGEMECALEDFVVLANGVELPVPELEMAVSGEHESVMEETVLEVEAGEIRKLRRTYVTAVTEFEGEASLGGETEDLSETVEEPLLGRTLVITVDDDGELTVEDMTGGDVEPLTDEELQSVEAPEQGELFLPTEPVEIGETWELIGDELQEELREGLYEGMLEGVTEEVDMEEVPIDIAGLMEELLERFTWEAEGELSGIRGEEADLAWTAGVDLQIDDLFDLIAEYGDDDLTENLPEDAEGELLLSLRLKGEGVFDLAAHSLREASFSGEFEFTGEVGFEVDDAALEASFELTGTLTLQVAVDAE